MCSPHHVERLQLSQSRHQKGPTRMVEWGGHCSRSSALLPPSHAQLLLSQEVREGSSRFGGEVRLERQWSLCKSVLVELDVVGQSMGWGDCRIVALARANLDSTAA
jgi:hypothetical protein